MSKATNQPTQGPYFVLHDHDTGQLKIVAVQLDKIVELAIIVERPNALANGRLFGSSWEALVTLDENERFMSSMLDGLSLESPAYKRTLALLIRNGIRSK